MKNRQTSIQTQIFIWVGFVVLLVVITNLIFNNFIMKDIYINNQKGQLKEIYGALYSRELTSDDLQKIYKECSIKNITLFITDSSFRPILYNYDNYGEDAKEDIVNHIKNFNDFDKDKIKGSLKFKDMEVLENSGVYSIVRVKDNQSNLEYLELRSSLNGQNILIRVSVDSIVESVDIFNTFTSFSLLIGLAFGLLFSFYLSRKFSIPLKKLLDISQEMINLNFNTKYDGEVNKEIDNLGNNFNQLSDKLKLSLLTLRKTNKKLEDTNTQLEDTNKQLEDANSQLEIDLKEKEKLNQTMKDFIGNVSHELKTPISLIQGYAEALQEGLADDKETMDYYTNIIIDESQRMNRLVKQLIDLTQLESGNFMDISTFDICEIIKEIVDSYEIKSKESGAHLELNLSNDEILVKADEFKIEQVIINYITNAFNHLDFDKNIRVNVFEKDDKVMVEVFNNGHNIPEEDIENVWLKFYKVDKAHTRSYGGSGIGLSIVKAIMESLNQEYGVRNEKDGVTFYFSLAKA